MNANVPLHSSHQASFSRTRTPLQSSPGNNAFEISMTQRKEQKRESYNLPGSVFLITSAGETLNLPVPSNCPADPLNFSRKKTAFAMSAIAFYSYVALVAPQAASLLYAGFTNEFGKDDNHPFTIETLVTAPTLFMGIGILLWIPLTLALGRRPVFMIANLVALGGNLGAGISRTSTHVLASVCCLGLAEGFSLSAALLMVIDMTFIGQRPQAIALLWSIVGFFGTCSLSIVPYLTNHGADWRTFYDVWSILAAVSCALAFVLCPETYFKRPTVAYDGLIILQSATEKLVVYEEITDNSSTKDLPAGPSQSRIRQVLDWLCFTRSPYGSWRAMGRCYLQIGFCLINPLVFWVALSSAANFAGMLYIGATYALVLSSPPYDLPTRLLILVNCSSGVGALLAYVLGGYLIGKALNRLARHNKGVREGEHYLVGYIIPVITGSLSTALYGLAVHFNYHFTVYYLAYGLNGLSWVTLSIFNTLWVTEALPRWAAPALVVVSGCCYIASFASSFFLAPWIRTQGYLYVGIELSALQIVTGLIAVPLAFWGKSARQRIHGRWASSREGALRPL